MEPTASAPSGPAAPAVDWSRLVGGFVALPRLLAERGVAPARVLEPAGLAPEALARADRRVGFAASARALSEAVRATHCAHFGLVAGRETRLADLGFVGTLTRAAPTVGSALRAFTGHHRLVSTGGALFLQQHDHSVSWGHAVVHPAVDQLAPSHDFAVAAGVSLLRELCGAQWNPSEVLLPHRCGADPRAYERFFRCPVRFGAEHCALRFPARTLDLALPTPASPARLALAPHTALAGAELLAEVYRMARLLLLQGQTHGDRIAQALGLHRRTLARRLQAQGLSFQQVLDEVRCAVARELLAETGLSVVDIALTLGYAEASPFVRAFRRWTGMAPLHWRSATRAARPDDGYAWPAAAAAPRRA
ncbi:MAG TPA: AraC family transcriptional regulator [Rubrivivax sp.]|nr:AraC family transcriptional regulator [Rubrivivax sp.]HPO19516.1 AraC family transcriptional regulator [Rubrivivax sp.]